MTKRIALLALGGAAALTLALPAAPASATCISIETTPVECAKEALGGTPSECIVYRTYVIFCPPTV